MALVLNKNSRKSDIDDFLKKAAGKKMKKGFNAAKYCGKVKLKEHPLEIQRKLRDEWL